MVEILYPYIWKWKKVRPIETLPGMRGGWIKDNDRGSEFNYYILQELL
jgi:hypothetical protein